MYSIVPKEEGPVKQRMVQPGLNGSAGGLRRQFSVQSRFRHKKTGPEPDAFGFYNMKINIFDKNLPAE
jgi:hypothetical protein